MVVPVWAEPLVCSQRRIFDFSTQSRSYAPNSVSRIFDFSTQSRSSAPNGVSLTSAHLVIMLLYFVDIVTSGRLSDTYVLITFELIFWAGKWRHQARKG